MSGKPRLCKKSLGGANSGKLARWLLVTHLSDALRAQLAPSNCVVEEISTSKPELTRSGEEAKASFTAWDWQEKKQRGAVGFLSTYNHQTGIQWNSDKNSDYYDTNWHNQHSTMKKMRSLCLTMLLYKDQITWASRKLNWAIGDLTLNIVVPMTDVFMTFFYTFLKPIEMLWQCYLPVAPGHVHSFFHLIMQHIATLCGKDLGEALSGGKCPKYSCIFSLATADLEPAISL